jgi:hypothetical protein
VAKAFVNAKFGIKKFGCSIAPGFNQGFKNHDNGFSLISKFHIAGSNKFG